MLDFFPAKEDIKSLCIYTFKLIMVCHKWKPQEKIGNWKASADTDGWLAIEGHFLSILLYFL